MADRIIMHIDMNSYFASVEQQANPHLRGKPIGVGGPNDGRTVLAAVSIEAKRRGVKTGMGIFEARRICPDIICVQGDYNKYACVTNSLILIYRRYTPLMEIFSIDEVFMDVTSTIASWKGAVRAVYEIKKAIKKEVGEWLTCSVGIGPNKLIAKLASDLKKPDGLVVVQKKDLPALLARTKLDEFCGIGSRTKRNLIAMGIDTVKKLGDAPIESLVKRFGKIGYVLHNMGIGEDDSPVVPYYEIPEPKSMGHSYTLPKDSSDPEVVCSTLLRLSEQVGRRMRAERFMGRVVYAGVRTSDFSFMGKQKALNRFIDDGYDIYTTAKGIIESLHYFGGVRLVAVSVSHLVKDRQQLSFLPEEVKKEKLLMAMDNLNNRYGEFAVGRATLMQAKMNKGTSGLGANRAMSRFHRNNDDRDHRDMLANQDGGIIESK
jgi:DNA polymerase-4